jgi:hypothetical protein
MSPSFVRQLIIHTICNVTGEEPEDILALDVLEVNTRDWEQIFSRLEATLDINTRLLTAATRTIDIDALAAELHARLSGHAHR